MCVFIGGGESGELFYCSVIDIIIGSNVQNIVIKHLVHCKVTTMINLARFFFFNICGLFT